MRVARPGLTLLVFGAIGLAAANALATTEVGDKLGNLLIGTRGADRLVGKAGGDLLKGRAGPDVLVGGKGRDGLIGGRGRDRMIGGSGNDVIRAADRRQDRRIDGGAGSNVCVIDVPADLPVTTRCNVLRAGPPPAGGGNGGEPQGGGLEVTSAQGLTCLPLLGCLFTITGKGADSLVGTVTAGGAVTSVANAAVNAVVTGTWLATGTYSCSASGGAGWLVVTIGTKSTPQIPVTC